MLTSSGDLQIVQLHRTDSGTYVCIADNGVGEPVFREVKLQVNGKLHMTAERHVNGFYNCAISNLLYKCLHF